VRVVDDDGDDGDDGDDNDAKDTEDVQNLLSEGIPTNRVTTITFESPEYDDHVTHSVNELLSNVSANVRVVRNSESNPETVVDIPPPPTNTVNPTNTTNPQLQENERPEMIQVRRRRRGRQNLLP